MWDAGLVGRVGHMLLVVGQAAAAAAAVQVPAPGFLRINGDKLPPSPPPRAAPPALPANTRLIKTSNVKMRCIGRCSATTARPGPPRAPPASSLGRSAGRDATRAVEQPLPASVVAVYLCLLVIIFRAFSIHFSGLRRFCFFSISSFVFVAHIPLQRAAGPPRAALNLSAR
ncbi:hypothetical protein JYU34_018457 [Plutella xylostella]|uniref:Uncharacterized protein n=1 Tax=Plutella xylostella TaxID=51655 RepID=A0ABQ7PZ11_PLUXY|nr:hypothetical protein JYU34_018457 [Plutella xylostella]